MGGLEHMTTSQLPEEYCDLLPMQATETVHPIHIPYLGESGTGTVILHQPGFLKVLSMEHKPEIQRVKTLPVTVTWNLYLPG